MLGSVQRSHEAMTGIMKQASLILLAVHAGRAIQLRIMHRTAHLLGNPPSVVAHP